MGAPIKATVANFKKGAADIVESSKPRKEDTKSCHFCSFATKVPPFPHGKRLTMPTYRPSESSDSMKSICLRNIDNPNEVILFFDAEDCPERGSW